MGNRPAIIRTIVEVVRVRLRFRCRVRIRIRVMAMVRLKQDKTRQAKTGVRVMYMV